MTVPVRNKYSGREAQQNVEKRFNLWGCSNFKKIIKINYLIFSSVLLHNFLIFKFVKILKILKSKIFGNFGAVPKKKLNN